MSATAEALSEVPLFAGLDDKERAILAYADQVCKLGNVSDKVFKALEQHFDARGIMEITFAIGSYYGTALIMNALKIKLEKKK